MNRCKNSSLKTHLNRSYVQLLNEIQYGHLVLNAAPVNLSQTNQMTTTIITVIKIIKEKNRNIERERAKQKHLIYI